ncbi:MAG: glycosyl transferase family 36 [Paenibacillaceae bacterium]|nr:glycosyl transferase family 36 [Paenibacillaceae bacterium]
MIVNTELLRQKARELALQVTLGKRDGAALKRLRREFEADAAGLDAFALELADRRIGCAQPAEEWLLDNAEFIDEQADFVKRQFAAGGLKRLPSVRGGNKLRLETICADYLETTDGSFDETTFETYIQAYQEVSALTLAECWNVPLLLRAMLIRRLAATMRLVRERRQACVQVDRFLTQLQPQSADTAALDEAMERAGLHLPLSGPWVVHLIAHLREWADDSSAVRQWLLCKLEGGADDLNRIVGYENKLQAAYQAAAGNAIGCLRSIERQEWTEAFARISQVEQSLADGGGAGLYPLLDAPSKAAIRRRIETLSARLRVPENAVARHAVSLAAAAHDEWQAQRTADPEGPAPRRAFLAYYLYEPGGIGELRRSLSRICEPRLYARAGIRKRAGGAYAAVLAGMLALFLALFAAWIGNDAGYTWPGLVAVLLVLLLPASEWVVVWLHFAIGRVSVPRPLLRYDFSGGIPQEATTLVVIPVIWSTAEEVRDNVDRLELHYLANRDPNLHFALLGDFTDAKERELPGDEALVAFAKERIEALNARYGGEGGSTFHLLQRGRQWNEGEAAFIGWERKRGKLVELVELLRGKPDTGYVHRSGDASVFARVRYVITLDADTQLPMGSAQRLVGTLHLPYNRPRLNRAGTRVMEGYGVLQPRIGISHTAAARSRLSSLWAGEPGIDPYAFAISDPYQDTFGQGIFTGKGIFDVEAFARILCDRIPEDRVLSHDLLEGGFLRAALLADIELVDDQPAKFISFQKRLHRWVRGDWQLLMWLFPRASDRHGEVRPVDLSALTRWQMLDNLRRSLMPPALYALLLFAFAGLPGITVRWLILGGVTLLLPVLRHVCDDWRCTLFQPKRLAGSASHALIAFVTLPFSSAMLADAIGKALFRQFVSKRRLLEWVSSADVERKGNERGPVMLGLTWGYALTAALAAVAVWNHPPGIMAAGLAIAIVWALAPLVVQWLDLPLVREESAFAPADADGLRELAGRIWAFYERFAGAADHYLPPDNVQIEPAKGVAHRTSPTNIGFLLTAVLAARDFGFIDTPGMTERLERTIGTIERMDKWHGHLYNWYDTTTLEPLPPSYVSTVDSGNFVASLMAVRQGLAEWLARELNADERRQFPGFGKLALSDAEFAAELADLPPGAAAGTGGWHDRGQALLARMEALIAATDFRQLYDYKSRLFFLGYNAAAGRHDDILYDLLASEARQASFVAIALGQISVAHWFRLGRTATKQGDFVTMVSWSGTMFEYLMPWLLMRTYRNTIWESTYRGVVRRQIEYARERGIPFGISESGYYAFDHQMNYQYRAFGVPGLGYKRGLEQDLVQAPYATVMALPYAPREGIDSLRRLEEMGASGEYGFYEAIDYTPERLPEGRRHMVIRSYMAHHQGMSLLTIANLLLPQTMIDRFHRDKRVQAAELLLTERAPARLSPLARRVARRSQRGLPADAHTAPVREFDRPGALTPEVCLLGGGNYAAVVTDSGGGYSLTDGLAVTRWREDPVADRWGSWLYIRDVASDALWSPSYLPCRVPSAEQRIRFSLDKAEFSRTDGDVRTTLEIAVVPGARAEVRRLTLENGGEARILEVTTLLEIVLAGPRADDAHQAFSKLFLETEYDAETECLLARRRPRSGDELPVWAFHALAARGGKSAPHEFETDRLAFIGRGQPLARPAGIDCRLGGSTGAVADPAFIMRRRLSLAAGERTQLFAVTGVAGTKEEALAMARELSRDYQVEHAFQQAWTHVQIEMKHLQLTMADATLYQQLAGRVLYAAPLEAERAGRIAANVKGQTGLWAYGISGERPIALVHVEDAGGLPFVAKLLQAHEYATRLGLAFDLVVLNESVEGYEQQVLEEVQRNLEHAAGRGSWLADSVHVIPAERLAPEDRTLLLAVARLALRADGASLRTQLRLRAPEAPVVPAPAAGTGTVAPVVAPASLASVAAPGQTEDGLFANGWGSFSADGEEYRIAIRHGNPLPAPWVNVIANPRFGCIVSELFTGYTWWQNSRENKLTPWSNDPALDWPGEACYLRDDDTGEAGMFATADTRDTDSFQAVHGRGYSRFRQTRDGLERELTVYVPKDDPVKIVRLRLRNASAKERRISLAYYAEWTIGVRREGNASYVLTDWNGNDSVLLARNAYQDTFRDTTAFLAFGDAAEALSWTGDRLEFLGRCGTPEAPAALARERLSGVTGALFDPCGAIERQLTLQPGEERTVYVLLGAESSPETAAGLVRRYREEGACERALAEAQAFWREALGAVTVATPSDEMNVMLNGWLLYQTLSCRMWARSAFYQSGGAYGFRDQLQDSLALLHSRPELTKRQIVLHASHQYIEGDVQHWWHEETSRGIRTRFSDDLLWLPYSVSRYVEHTGDFSLLDEMAPYLTSEQLKEDEHERYEETVDSGRAGTVYEHCLLAIERSLRFGEHGLPLIGIGDWNDGMSRIGFEGRGESVWLAWFQCDVLERMADLCAQRGDRETAERYLETRDRVSAAANTAAWDGQWFRRACTDSGEWLGSVANAECRIDAIAQSWSVISRAGAIDKARQAMLSFDRELVDRGLSVAAILTPPFNRTEPNPGYIQGYPPGLRENGAQYTHGVIWSIVAWSGLGEGDKAFELFHMLNPVTHALTATEVRKYAGEPYAIAADVYTSSPHKGRAGWTWYTGAAGWMYQAGVEAILGLRRRGDKLHIAPCVPHDWPGYEASYRFGGTVYRIALRNPAGNKTGWSTLAVDGEVVAEAADGGGQVTGGGGGGNRRNGDGRVGGGESGGTENGLGPYVRLYDDGRERFVELTM